MKVLAIDTSAGAASAAIVEDNVLLGEYILNHGKTHSQKIMVMIKELLEDLELKIGDIDLFAVANGPGSFTGLRIGVAAMKALAHSVKKPIVGVSPLEAIAYSLPFSGTVVPVMDARQNRIYTAVYRWDKDGMTELTAPTASTIEECAEWCGKLSGTIVFAGDGAAIHEEYLRETMGERAVFAPFASVMQRASSIAAIALNKAKNGGAVSYLELKPEYLRKSQAERELERNGK